LGNPEGQVVSHWDEAQRLQVVAGFQGLVCSDRPPVLFTAGHQIFCGLTSVFEVGFANFAEATGLKELQKWLHKGYLHVSIATGSPMPF
jgi:hypothetical protein